MSAGSGENKSRNKRNIDPSYLQLSEENQWNSKSKGCIPQVAVKIDLGASVTTVAQTSSTGCVNTGDPLEMASKNTNHGFAPTCIPVRRTSKYVSSHALTFLHSPNMTKCPPPHPTLFVARSQEKLRREEQLAARHGGERLNVAGC